MIRRILISTTLLWGSTLALATQPTLIESETNLVPDSQAEREEKEDATKGKPDPQAVPPPANKVPAALLNLGEVDAFSPYAFVVDKATRTLTIWKYDSSIPTLVTSHPADLGRESGDKTSSGDRKTPEGIYFFQTRIEGAQLDFNEYGSRAFTMNYPNYFDSVGNKTGSGIWLHSIPETKSLLRGSRGCVVVRNEVIQKISDYVMLKKTPIIILPSVTYLTAEEFTAQKTALLAWVEGWRKSWEAKDVNSYLTYYGDSFRALGMDRDQWRRYKEGLNAKYKSIAVKISNPMILAQPDRAIVRFIQAYRSDKKEDVGEKILYLTKDSTGQFRILGEEWEEVPKDNLAAAKLMNSKDTNL